MKKTLIFLAGFIFITIFFGKNIKAQNEPPQMGEIIYLGTYDGGVSYKKLYNNLDSLIFVVEKLEKMFEREVLVTRNRVVNNTLAFIRSYKESYNSANWNIVAGVVEEKLLLIKNELDSKSDYSILDFLKYFQEDGTYLVDPINPENELNKIDFYHMFATMDGTFENTGMFLLNK